jgi:ABC-type branched-subunit amino acid transport system ATPase component
MTEAMRVPSEDSGEVLLQVEGLSVGYGGQPIVNDVSLRAVAGQITALVGLNGAGKSTLLKGIAGILRPSAGKVILGGRQVEDRPAESMIRLGMSYVPQLRNVFGSLSVYENLEMGGYILKGGRLKRKIDDVLHLFPDLEPALRRQARTLSGGQSHMLAIARGLMVDPKVLLLDEPMAGLSPLAEKSVRERIHAVNGAGVAVVIVDQNVRAALKSADWGYVLALGRNAAEGPGATLLETDIIGNLFTGAA